jgi:hypothetical protein
MQSASSITRKRHSSEIIIKVFDKDGNLIQVHKQKMHSIVPNVGNYFANLLQGTSATSPTVYLLSTANLVSPAVVSGYLLGLSLNGPFPQGIVLGSDVSSTAPMATEVTMPYMNGSSSGQMLYGSPTISLSQSSTQSTISITQIIRNPTSSSELVSQLGLYGVAILTSSMSSISPYINSASPYAVFAYDFISPYITVPSLGALQVTVNINFD